MLRLHDTVFLVDDQFYGTVGTLVSCSYIGDMFYWTVKCTIPRIVENESIQLSVLESDMVKLCHTENT
jgi:hypothetical protein